MTSSKFKHDSLPLSELRARAEERLGESGYSPPPFSLDDGSARLFHELEVQQVALEIQSEELRRAEARLQEAHDRYFELYDLAPVGYLTLDALGRVLDGNLRAAQLLGVERPMLIGERLVELLLPSSTPELARHLREVFTSAEVRRCELALPGPRGARRIQMESALVERPGERRCRAVLVDVTALADAERVARQNAERLRAVLDTASDAIVSIDGAGRIESFNEAAERMFGYRDEEVLGRNVQLLMPAPRAEEHDDPLRRYAEMGEAKLLGVGREMLGQRKDGTTFPLEVSIGERWEGNKRAFTGVLRDLSERKRLEEELRQSQKLEPVGRLASGLAHEYRNLLMGIQGFTQMALEELGDSPARGHVEEIRATAIRGSSLAAQLLAFSRRDDEGALRRKRLDPTVAAAQRLLRALLTDEVELELDLAAPESSILAEPGAVEQILLNLALNASDAMPDGGRLTISTRRLGDDHAVLRVSDTGMGMNHITRQRLFEPFFTTKPEGGGTGLGLVAVQRIVERIGGRIEVDSDVGCGATFRLLFPLATAAASTRTRVVSGRAPAATTPDQPRTALVVEDERLVLVTVDHYLRRAGYEALLARDPQEALELARDRAPGAIDVLLTDVSLPGVGGRELALAVRERHPGVAVLFMSAYPRAQLLDQQRIEPGAPTIEKPFDEQQLRRRLDELLRARGS